MIRVADVTPLGSYVVRLRFDDGTEKELDLGPYLRGPVFEPLRDPDKFREVYVDKDLGTIVWPNGADMCPDVLYHGRAPVSPEG